MPINKAIEKLEYLKTHEWDYNIPRCRPWKTDKINEIINDLKSIEKVTGEEIADAIFPGYIASPEIAAKIISKRIWGE